NPASESGRSARLVTTTRTPFSSSRSFSRTERNSCRSAAEAGQVVEVGTSFRVLPRIVARRRAGPAGRAGRHYKKESSIGVAPESRFASGQGDTNEKESTGDTRLDVLGRG